MAIIYSVGMSKNDFDVAPNHGRTKFLVDVPHEGDNIDDKNPLYNEITGLYHLWKHHGPTDYVGLEHYRRAIWDVARTDIADEYCKMVFDLCFNVKPPEGAKRFFGFCCEKLWSPWAAFKGLKVYKGRIHVYSNKPKDAGY